MKRYAEAMAAFFVLALFVSVAGQFATPAISLGQQDEGDVDESYDLYGPDIDEEIEYDDAVVSVGDTTEERAVPEQMKTAGDSLIRGISWLGHASLLIEDSLIVYIDPYDLPEDLPRADMILITHGHSDHFSPDDISRLLKATTVVISVEALRHEVPDEVKDFRGVAPGDTIAVGGVSITAVPAYNIGKKFHPKDRGWVGFVLHLDGRSIYHAGDTDLIPEMEDIDADIALLPIGGKYTMDAHEAAKAANLMQPKVVVPMHWGKIVGGEEDVKAFVNECDVPVVVMEPKLRRHEPEEK